MEKIVALNLPEWAWVDGFEHEKGGDPLQGRSVFMHIKTATIMEVFDKDLVVPHEGVVHYDFTYVNRYDIIEEMTILLHHSATLADEDAIDIMEEGAEWYKAYCDWEDNNIHNDELANLN